MRNSSVSVSLRCVAKPARTRSTSWPASRSVPRAKSASKSPDRIPTGERLAASNQAATLQLIVSTQVVRVLGAGRHLQLRSFQRRLGGAQESSRLFGLAAAELVFRGTCQGERVHVQL